MGLILYISIKIVIEKLNNPELTLREFSRAYVASPAPSKLTSSADFRAGICGGTVKSTYSFLIETTGSARAALNASVETVSPATKRARRPARAKTLSPTATL